MTRFMRFVVPFALVAAACGGAATDTTVAAVAPPSTEPPPTTTEAVTTTTVPATTTSTLGPVDWVYTPVADKPTVTVIDPGAEPRTALEFSPTVGASAATTVLMTMEVEVEVDGEASVTAMQVRMPTEARVLEVTEGRYVVATTYLAPEVVSAGDEATKAAVEGELAQLDGVTLRSLVSRSGELLAHESLDGLAGSQFLPDTLGSFSAPLPRDAVGVGAVWEVTTRANLDTMPVDQTVRFTLVDVQGAEVNVEMTITQDLLDVEFSGVEDLAATGSGSGTAVWNLLNPLLMAGTSEITSVTTATIDIEGETSTLNQTSTMQMEITSE